MDVSRRQLVALGATGAAGAIIGRTALTGSPAAADVLKSGRGVHVHGTVVNREPPTPTAPKETMAGMAGDPRVDPRIGRHMTLKFLEPSDAGFGYVHAGARATPRVSD